MSKVTAKTDMTNIESIEDLVRYLTPVIKDIVSQVNGNLTFGDNVFNRISDVSFPTVNTTVRVPHGLGRTPSMWISGNESASGNIYQTQAPDGTLLYLASSAVMSAKILVI